LICTIQSDCWAVWEKIRQEAKPEAEIHRRPDIVAGDKDNNRALLIDIAVPADARVEEKEQEKMDRYQDLSRKLKRLWKVETKVIPVVVGALQTVTKGPEKNLKKARSNANS